MSDYEDNHRRSKKERDPTKKSKIKSKAKVKTKRKSENEDRNTQEEQDFHYIPAHIQREDNGEEEVISSK
jgi:hypothetical protein